MILCGIQLAIDMNFSHICVEFDVASIAQQLSSGTSSCYNVRMVVDDILVLLDQFSIMSIRRSANKADHGLAKFVLNLSSDLVWVKDFSSCVASLVSDDIRDSL
ncbi:hypothetical protein ACOSQ3_031525 [Xanthoceras sorbifolium]